MAMLSAGGSSGDQAGRGVCPPLSVRLGAVMSVSGTDKHKNCYPIQCHHELTGWTWLWDLTCWAPEEEGQALISTALGRVCRSRRTGGGRPVQSGLALAGVEGRHPPPPALHRWPLMGEGEHAKSLDRPGQWLPAFVPVIKRGWDILSPLATWGRFPKSQVRTRNIFLLGNYIVLSSCSTARPAGPRSL